MKKEDYMKKYMSIIENVESVLKKCRTYSIKEIEEMVILEISSIYEYIRGELETNISTFYLRVNSVWEHVCISQEEKKKLDVLRPKLTAYQKRINYLTKNHELIEKVEDIIEKCQTLKISELYEYIKAKELTLHKIESVIQNLYENNCISKIKKEQFNKKYTELVNYHESTKEIREREIYNKQYSELIAKLIELSLQEKLDDKELDEYIKRKFNYDLNEIKLRVKTASSYNGLTDQQIKSLDRIFQRVKEYRKQHRKAPFNTISMETIRNASTIVEEFIESGKGLLEYYRENNLVSYQYRDYLRILRKHNPILYGEHNKYRDLRKKYIEEIIINTKDDILDQMENGIVLDNDSIRKFDIIDYYLLTGTSMEEYEKVLREITDNIFEVIPLLQFLDKHSSKKLSLKEINGFLDCTFIKNGVEITEDIKIEILFYLQNRMIPLTNITIRTALDRYLNNTLFEEQNYTHSKR